MHHVWSKDGVTFSGAELMDHLINVTLPQEKKMEIPTTPPVVLPSHMGRGKLGTTSSDCRILKEHKDAKKCLVMEGVSRCTMS